MSAVPAEAPMRGSTMPRLWTPPLIVGEAGPCGCGCALTPETSYGFDVDDFARYVLRSPLDAWQRWLVIHAGELLPDGRPRFRTVLAIVARQQGKSFLLRVLILYWMFVEKRPITLATSTDRGYAKAAWMATCDFAKTNPFLAAELPPRPQVLQIGEEEFRNVHGAKYRFAAVNRRTGRSLTIDRLVLDEIREHSNFDAWGAATNAQNAVYEAQALAVSNQGDDSSVVLDWLRTAALGFLETGEGDPRLGLFEYSAPDGADPTDPAALCAANPNAGHRTDLDALIGAARQAVAGDAQALTSFKTEVLCMRVDQLDPAIEPQAWTACGEVGEADFSPYRGRVAMCLDVSLDGLHASLIAAAVGEDGRVRIGVVEAWTGRLAPQQLRAALPGIVERIRPRVLGWFPNGPAAAVAAELKERKGWPPRRTEIDEIRGDVTAVCMGLAEQVVALSIVHHNDAMINAHIGAAQKLKRGDGWVFARQESGPIDGAYAVAGAVHLARTMPKKSAPLVAL